MENQSNLNNFTLEDITNQKLIDCLPGVFFIYEIIGENFYMKSWNKNHEQTTGYVGVENQDQSPFLFIMPNHHQKARKAIEKVISTGEAKQVIVNLITKNRVIKPHIFEGYRLEIGDQLFFMGMGIDISDLVSVRAQVKYLQQEKEEKEKELLTLTLQEQKKEELLNTIYRKLEEISLQATNPDNIKEIEMLSQKINSHLSTGLSWLMFKKTFNSIHSQFFIKLKNVHPGITKGEMQFCAYIKINMSNDQICSVMNISKDGLTKKRYRLKQKFSLEKSKNIEDYILKI